jgi:hypothetical protein
VRAFPLTDREVNLLRSGDSDYVVAQMGWGWTREFVPATAQDVDSIYTPIAKPSAPVADRARALPSIQVQEIGVLSDKLRVSAPQELDLTVHSFYFPEWQAYIDGAPSRTFPRGSLGLASVTVPPGDHVVSFQFQDTALRIAANAISLLTGIAILVGLFVYRRRAAMVGVAGLVLLGVLLVWHTRAANAASFDLLAPPIAVSANLDNLVMLVGYATDRPSYRTNETIYVTLYWLALNEMDKDYNVSVQLIGLGDLTLAQQDGPPDQGLTPTTRWLPGEIVVDRRVVPLREVTPGEYRIVASMYLPVTDSFTNLGNPIDLGRIRVSP